MRSYLFGAVSALSLLAATSAYADDQDGWYLRGNSGYGVHLDAELEGGIDSEQHGNGLQSEGNVAYSLGGGYDFGDHWRVELDYDSLETSFGSISQTPGSQGSLDTDTAMINAIYDFGDFKNFEPYIGAGVGLVRGKGRFSAHDFPGVENELVRNPTCVGARIADQASSCAISDSDTGLGWQLLAGLGYKISDNLTWDTHYTYLNGPDLDLNGHIANSNTGTFSNFDADLEDVGAHTLMTGLRYKFGHDHAAPVTKPEPIVEPTFKCWDGNMVFNSGQCATKPEPIVEYIAPAPAPAPVIQYVEPVVQAQTYTCWDGTTTFDLGTCAAEPVVQRTNLNVCSESPVAIFNVPANKSPKQMSRLGTLPEFGDSHSLSPDQFYEKLNARYNDNATDKAYLNYLFKSMGYSNGWSDAQSYMFSDEVLPVGTRGLLGLGKVHHYEYSILPTNDRDRQAFRIQSANGSVVHFMKTCGNYMYACE